MADFPVVDLSQDLNPKEPVDKEDDYLPTEVVSMIVSLRLYDVAMALLHKIDPKAANALLEVHQEGKVLSGSPWFDGTFVTDALNAKIVEDGHDYETD
jgi:hypothetical protein